MTATAYARVCGGITDMMQPPVPLVLLAVCSLAGLILARELEHEEFLQWRNSYHQGKDIQWSSYRVWRKNAEFVRKQNSLGLSYTVAMNKFGHMVTMFTFVYLQFRIRLGLGLGYVYTIQNNLRLPNVKKIVIPSVDRFAWHYQDSHRMFFQHAAPYLLLLTLMYPHFCRPSMN